jgi:peptidoglycan hydrolase-like protein with peptidoglycan-binding domain
VGDTLHPGDSGAYVLSVQQRLSSLGYWLGTPDGTYGGLTSQAVMALQKAAGLGRDGVFGPATRRALEAGVRPQSHVGGTGVEIDKARQLLLVVRGGSVRTILNTSTGSGQPYQTKGGGTAIATTPAGTFSVFRTVDHLDKGPLGDLWRPRYFNGGIAVHGAGYVPGYPASHGCARVSNPAMDMIWAAGLMPVGSRVVVY